MNTSGQAQRAVFIDIENTCGAQDIASVLDELGLPDGAATRLFAVGNWAVVSAETARLLSRAGVSSSGASRPW
jgi:hypothetical protein